MERHPALQDLSRDHHHGLHQAQLLVRAAEGHERGGDPEATARSFLDFWNGELALHFLEEDLVLLPIYGRHVALSGDKLAGRLVEDHAWFRDTVPELAQRVEEGGAFQELMGAVGNRLREHARFEDRELFPRLEELLSDEELGELAQASRTFREEHRGTQALGPRA